MRKTASHSRPLALCAVERTSDVVLGVGAEAQVASWRTADRGRSPRGTRRVRRSRRRSPAGGRGRRGAAPRGRSGRGGCRRRARGCGRSRARRAPSPVGRARRAGLRGARRATACASRARGGAWNRAKASCAQACGEHRLDRAARGGLADARASGGGGGTSSPRRAGSPVTRRKASTSFTCAASRNLSPPHFSNGMLRAVSSISRSALM